MQKIKNFHRKALRSLGAYFWPFALLACACSSIQPGSANNQTTFQFGLIGDLPYSAEDERKFPNLIEDINKADLARADRVIR